MLSAPSARPPRGQRRSAAQRGARPGPGAPRLVGATLLLGSIAVALPLRLVHIRASYEVFVDEIEYVDIARSVAAGHGPRLFGTPFFLHPPAWFYLLAAVIRVGGWTRFSRLQLVFALRPADALAGSLSCALLALLVWRSARPLTGRRTAAGAGAAAGLVLAVDPYSILFDSRVFLEPFAVLCILAALLLLPTAAASRQTLRALAAGLAAGLAVLTKEEAALVTVLPLLVSAVTGFGAPRRAARIAAATAVGCYGVYLAVVAAAGQFSHWAHSTLSGVLRLLGVRQVTGFNRAGSPSLTGRLVSDAPTLGGSYLLLGVGALATLVLLVRLWRRTEPAQPEQERLQRLVLWVVFSGAALGYALFFGTLEEQEFDLLVAPALAVTVLTAVLWVSPPARFAGRRLVGSLALVAALLAADAASWVDTHELRRDDALSSMLGWMHTHLPAGTRVDLLDGVSPFLATGLRIDVTDNLAFIRAHDAYVLVSTTLSEQGYAPAGANLLGRLTAQLPVAHVDSGITDGRLELLAVAARG